MHAHGPGSRLVRAVPVLSLVAALYSIPPVHAGVDAWTTTGPRSLWTFMQADARAGGVMFVADSERWARSADGGASWSLLDTPAGQTLRVRAICADPQTPGRFYGALIGGDSQRFHRSDDGGLTWSVLPGSIAGGPVPFQAVASSIDCDGSRLLVARSGANAGLYRSDDGASTPFQRVEIPSGVGEIVFARAGDRLVVANWGGRNAYASADRGATWAPTAFVLPEGFEFQSIAWAGGGRYVALARSSSTDNLLHFAVWISDDHGVTFTQRPAAAFIGGGPRVMSDPLQRTRLLIVDQAGLRVSTDAGESWTVVSGVPAGETVRAAPWAAPRTAGGSALWITTPNRGLMLSTDLGASFVAQNRGLPGAKAATVDSTVYQGELIELAVAREFQRRTADRNRWSSVDYPDCFVAAGETPGLLIAPGGYRSLDGGATWVGQGIEEGPTCTLATLHRHPGVPQSLIASNRSFATGFPLVSIGSRVWLGENDGASWRVIPDSASNLAFGEVYDAIVAPSDPDVVYVSGNTSGYEGGVYVGPKPCLYRSTDRGATWAQRRVPGDLGGPLYVDPIDPRHLLLAGLNGNTLIDSQDGGESWAALPPIPSATTVLSITVDEGSTPRRLYAGTDDGVFVLVGNSTSWQRIGASQGMKVNKILVEGAADRRTISMATDSGVWELTQDPTSATLPVYRFYNTQTRTHFYTASETERAHVLATWPHFVPEGIAFHAVKAERGTIGQPVWRFFNTQTGTHFYTASAAERAHVLATWPQFVEEGEVYRALAGTEAGTVKLFRFFNTQTGAHFYTTEDDERDFVNARLPMFIDEGATYSVYPAAPPP